MRCVDVAGHAQRSVSRLARLSGVALALGCGAPDAPEVNGPAVVGSGAVLADTAAVQSATPPAPERASAEEGDATRMQVRLTGCMPVGYGEACGAEVWSRRTVPEKARLEVCVGSRGAGGLYERVDSASGIGKPPVELWMDVVPAPETERYCGVIILESGAHLRVVDFER